MLGVGKEEKDIELCKQLANMYDNEMFDYEKLSWTRLESGDVGGGGGGERYWVV